MIVKAKQKQQDTHIKLFIYFSPDFLLLCFSFSALGSITIWKITRINQRDFRFRGRSRNSMESN
jgi:hypothetical protein